MKGTLTILCAGLALSWVAVAGAQGYGSGQSSESRSSKHSKMSREVTLTGCLEQGSSPNMYVLRKATREEGSSSSMSRSSTGTSGSSQGEQAGSSGSSMSGNEGAMDFELVAGRNASDLKKYVGHRVQVKGTVEPMEDRDEHSGMSSGSSSGEMGRSSGQSGSSSGGSMSGGQGMSAGPLTHRVKVSSVKSLGSSCQ
jgi:hypothetical protein